MLRHKLLAATTALTFAAAALPGLATDAAAGERGRPSERHLRDAGDQGYRRDAGAVRAQIDNRHGGGFTTPERGQGFDPLSDGGVLDDAREDNLNTAPDVYSTGGREEFLEDGGSISSPIVYRDGIRVLRGPAEGHWRHVVVEPVNLSRRGSVTFIASDVGAEAGNRRFRREAAAEGAVGIPAALTAAGPKIIDVAAERLDRRALPPSGIETVWSGGAKIIRIGKDYRRGADDTASAK
ncbi:hypothetical protein [Jiella sonneratiae]|uniref:Uncharacterized protein n=1 Tax=Jiella sonneratiae TaxID=2816856 RepID=A0ABS3J4D3_9HYPH|nr:hypothetical protein [Jiella sonneratiae]MBO0904543.1 hypothetical protein [Jiella sonneratiae]